MRTSEPEEFLSKSCRLMGAGVDYHLLAGIDAVAETASRLGPDIVALDETGTYKHRSRPAPVP